MIKIRKNLGLQLGFNYYCVSSFNKHRASNKCHPLIRATLLGADMKITASLLISGAPLNAGLIRNVTIFS